MKIIVCGGRGFDDYEFLIKALDHAHNSKPITVLIEGGAKGADAHAKIWAKNKGIQVATCEANWDAYKKAAGPIRNGFMLTLNPDGVIAFPGGSGTKNMVTQAKLRSVPVWEPN